MAHSPDDPPSDRVSPVSPPALPVTSGESEPATSAHPQQTDEEGKGSADPPAEMAVGGDPPRRPRRRRRRRPPREAGVAPQPGELSASPQGEGDSSWRRRRRYRGAGPDTGTGEAPPREEIQAVEGPPAYEPASPPHEAAAVREGGPGVSASRDGKIRTYLGRRRRPRIPPASASSGGTTDDKPSVERGSQPTGRFAQNSGAGIELHAGQPGARRRRRRSPRPAAGTPISGHQPTGRSADEDSAEGAPGNRIGRYREFPGRGSRDPRKRDERRMPGQAEHDQRRANEASSPRPGNRERASSGPRERRKGGRGPRERGGRDVPQRRPEPRLYALEAVVDRGFEDVPHETDGTIRRVHWTITKRTVADQQSGKPMTTTYVLKRDGVDTEFPSLGTARMAANKTIIHPEKLTLSKAEHAAARK
jgi:hypothetical protein